MSSTAESVATEVAANADATADPVGGAESAPAGEEVLAKPVTSDEKTKNQEAFNRLTRERYEAQARAENESRERQRIQREYDELKAKSQQVAPAKFPTLDEAGNDFDRHAQMVADYVKATTAQPNEDELFEKFVQRMEQRQQKTTQQTGWEKQLSDVVKARPDAVQRIYADPAEGGPIVTESMRDVLFRSDRGAEIALYLADNREANEAIARMHPLDQALELGAIKAKLEAPKAPPPAKPSVSQAPPPAPTIGASTDVGEKDPSKMTRIQYAKWRRQHGG